MTIFTLCLILTCSFFSVHASCTYDDEFIDGTATDEWLEFTQLLENKTFTTYTIPCGLPDKTNLTINVKSDFLWHLRYEIYNQHHQTEKTETVQQCIANSTICDEAFRTCMKNARIAMIKDLNDIWDQTIQQQLQQMKNDNKCPLE